MGDPTVSELKTKLRDLRGFAQTLASVPYQARNHRLLFKTNLEAEEVDRDIRQREWMIAAALEEPGA